ncbi:unnamed protein product, partial [Discosporangium mesarthrocarpum]
QLVVLTPYLAQLQEIRDRLDGHISDEDAQDLAGAIAQPAEGVSEIDGSGAGAAVSSEKRKRGHGSKRTSEGWTAGVEPHSQIRVATVDNYQGEESDVVIVSLVRSNDRGDMGFVCEPNRLNVTISRARYGRTFLND